MSVPSAELEVLDHRECTLGELFDGANREHDFGCHAAAAALAHWMSAGDLLIEARRIAEAAGRPWGAWIEEYFHGGYSTAQSFIRMATYRSLLEDRADEVTNIAQALRYLRGLPPSAPRGPRGGYTSADPDGSLAGDACRLASGGVSQRDIAAMLGVSAITVWRWLNPDVARQRRAEERRRRYGRDKARRVIERREARDAAVRKVGGSVAEAYSMIRKTAQVVDRAHGKVTNREVRAALSASLAKLHSAEDEIVRALGIS